MKARPAIERNKKKAKKTDRSTRQVHQRRHLNSQLSLKRNKKVSVINNVTMYVCLLNASATCTNWFPCWSGERRVSLFRRRKVRIRLAFWPRKSEPVGAIVPASGGLADGRLCTCRRHGVSYTTCAALFDTHTKPGKVQRYRWYCRRYEYV